MTVAAQTMSIIATIMNSSTGLAKPHAELDAEVLIAGKAFEHGDVEAWWLAYDTLNAVEKC